MRHPVMPRQVRAQVAVFGGDALGPAGGSRCEEHVRQVAGRCRERRVLVPALEPGARPVRSSRSPGVVMPASASRQRSSAIISVGAAPRDQVLHERRWIVGFEAHVGAAGFRHRQHGGDPLGRSRHAQRDDVLRSDAVAGEHARQPIGLRVQLAVGETPLAMQDRDRVGSVTRPAARTTPRPWRRPSAAVAAAAA